MEKGKIYIYVLNIYNKRSFKNIGQSFWNSEMEFYMLTHEPPKQMGSEYFVQNSLF